MVPGVVHDGVSVTGVSAPAGMPSSINGRVFRCTFSTNLTTGSAFELLEIEQIVRDLTWVKTCIDQADTVSWLPPDSIIGESAESATAWPGVSALDINAFRPAGVTNLFVAGLRADVPRALAAEMRNPARMMALGERIGALAADEALSRPVLQGLSVPGEPGLNPASEVVSELLAGIPPHYTNSADLVNQGTSSVPVFAECDVLVVGAGTAGAPAAIAAGRAGAETIVVEYLYNMGGVQTDGRIGSYYHGNPRGFTTSDVDPGVKATGSVLATSKSEWYRHACREAGVKILYGSLAAGALVEGTTLKGVVVVLPDGQRGIIRAEAVVDASGNAVIAAAAGEETEFINVNEIAVQGAGQAPHILGASYTNADVGFVDDRDVCDVFFFGRRAYASINSGTAWMRGRILPVVSGRRLVGVVTVSPVDILNYRTWPDTIVRPISNFDSHGYTVHDLFFIMDPGTSDITANLPYRALLPKTLDGLLVAGLGMSAHRDAMPLLRMQRDMQNQGYAAGYAAALAVQDAVTLRNVDMSALQSHLVAKNIISSGDVATPDNFPLNASVIQAAVHGLTNDYATLHTVLADVDSALPMLRDAYAAQSDPENKLIYAHVLGILNDPSGSEDLADAVSSSDWDAGWVYRGMGQYGHCVSRMDSYIIALGRTLDPVAISPVVAKTALLDGSSAFSHIRAVCLALEKLSGALSVSALSSLLEDVEGYAMTDSLVTPLIPGYSNSSGDTERDHSLKEIDVARALFKLGDDDASNGSRVLGLYASDPREIYASHARLVLEEGPVLLAADGVWISTQSNAEWFDAVNWQNDAVANGPAYTAWFTNQISEVQSISIGQNLEIGKLILGEGERLFDLSCGALIFSSLDGDIEFAGDGNVKLIYEASLEKQLQGKITVSGGVFEIVTGRNSLSVDIPYASFESDPLLPADPIGARDKRGDAAEVGCPGWDFVDSGNTESGYQRNGSYYSGYTAAQTSDGVQTAFVRSDGMMSTVINVQTAGVFTLSYIQCPRGYAETWYDNHTLRVKVDEALKHETIVSNHWFESLDVDLGHLDVGSHTLLFEGVITAGTTDPCTLIDSLVISGISDYREAPALSGSEWHLRVDDPGQIALNYSGLVNVGSLVINGVPVQGGIVNSNTHPDLFTGDGSLKIMHSGMVLTIR